MRWLATGVWRPASLDKSPQPVDRQKISAEKMDVFKKVVNKIIIDKLMKNYYVYRR